MSDKEKVERIDSIMTKWKNDEINEYDCLYLIYEELNNENEKTISKNVEKVMMKVSYSGKLPVPKWERE